MIHAPAGVKVVRKLAHIGRAANPKNFYLEQEVLYNQQGNVTAILTYQHTASIFGKASTIHREDFTYYAGSRQVQSSKKTDIHEIEGKRYEQAKGVVYDKEGNATHLVYFRAGGAVDSIRVQEAANARAQQSNGFPNFHQQYTDHFNGNEPLANNQNADWDYMPQRMKLENLNRYAAPKRIVTSGKPSQIRGPLSTSDANLVREELADGYAIKELNEEGKVLSEHRVTLNKQAQPVRVVVWNGLDHVRITTYQYDAAGNEIEAKQVDKKGAILAGYNHTYTSDGLLTRSVKKGNRGKTVKTMKYEYEYYR